MQIQLELSDTIILLSTSISDINLSFDNMGVFPFEEMCSTSFPIFLKVLSSKDGGGTGVHIFYTK